eukprot:TRINITY_DN73553_c0_g1_i1.p1 TRINITY_DN73553_c0_g1~~TRINITY_DN73553_c0_g1_i1.p1  ORF type:complete len:303 (+),score=34.23 TRINITY_DN73553_c0_g1_i1:80-988(+)
MECATTLSGGAGADSTSDRGRMARWPSVAAVLGSHCCVSTNHLSSLFVRRCRPKPATREEAIKTRLGGVSETTTGSAPRHFALRRELENVHLFYGFSWQHGESVCNFDVDIGCVALDYGGMYLRSVSIVDKGNLKAIGLCHGRQRHRLARTGPAGVILGEEGIVLELGKVDRAIGYLVFVHMIYSTGKGSIREKVTSCRSRLVVAPADRPFVIPEEGEGEAVCVAEGTGNDGEEGGALISAVIWRSSIAASSRGVRNNPFVSRWRFDEVSRCVEMPKSASYEAMRHSLRAVCVDLCRSAQLL